MVTKSGFGFSEVPAATAGARAWWGPSETGRASDSQPRCLSSRSFSLIGDPPRPPSPPRRGTPGGTPRLGDAGAWLAGSVAPWRLPGEAARGALCSPRRPGNVRNPAPRPRERPRFTPQPNSGLPREMGGCAGPVSPPRLNHFKLHGKVTCMFLHFSIKVVT